MLGKRLKVLERTEVLNHTIWNIGIYSYTGRWFETRPATTCGTWAFGNLAQDIGEEDRLMSRLEAEMQVYTEDAGEYTLGLLDKGNGKARGIWFFVWGLSLGSKLGLLWVLFFNDEPTPQENERMLSQKNRDYFNRKIVFWPAFFRAFFKLVFRGIFHQLRFFFLLHRFKWWRCVGATLLSDLADWQDFFVFFAEGKLQSETGNHQESPGFLGQDQVFVKSEVFFCWNKPQIWLKNSKTRNLWLEKQDWLESWCGSWRSLDRCWRWCAPLWQQCAGLRGLDNQSSIPSQS